MREHCRPKVRTACSLPFRRGLCRSKTVYSAAVRRIHLQPHTGSLLASLTALQVLQVRPEVRAMSASALLPRSP